MRGRKRKDSPIQDFFDDDWLESDLGRSPKAIAERLDVSVEKITAVLRHRRDGLSKKAEKVPLAFQTGAWYLVDPYRMRVEFHSGIEVVTMSEEQMILTIRISQDVASNF